LFGGDQDQKIKAAFIASDQDGNGFLDQYEVEEFLYATIKFAKPKVSKLTKE